MDVDLDRPTFDIPVDQAPKTDAAPEAADDAAADVAAPDVADAAPEAGDDAAADGAADAPPDVAADAACRARCGGFCVDTDTDVYNCGSCGNDCTLRTGVDPMRARCVAGRCDFTNACLPGRANCSGNPDDGCEAMVNTAMRCGTCMNACTAAAPNCAMSPTAPGGFACSSGCAGAGQARCNGTCIDVSSDVRNCGGCGMVCPTGSFGTASCVMGRCQLMCTTGRADCDMNAANGCETATASNVMHCGMCGNMCSAPAGSTPICSAGMCTITCASFQGNCDMNAANGCETDLRTSTMHCGSCGNACSGRPNSSGTCTSGSCNVVCNPGYGNCNGSVVDGCEVELASSGLNCGACGRRCAAAANAQPACSAGSCAITCNPNFGNCNGNNLDGCETPLASDPMNCGACNMRCPSASGAAATCTSGMCGLACMTGQGNCDMNAANGCETDLTTSNAHCGACGNACNAPSNGSSRCAMGRCAITCDDGFILSGTMCVRAPPRPVSPAGGAIVTSRRPTFRVALPSGITGARIEVCADRACTQVATTLTATGTAVTSSATFTPGVYYWRMAGMMAGSVVTTFSPVTEFAVAAHPTATTSATWGPIFDADGDRYVDQLVGYSLANAVYYRRNLGGAFSTLVTTSLTGSTSFGTAVAAAGDVNGDGYSDLVVGAPSANQAVIHHGSASGPMNSASTSITAPSGVTRFGAAVASAGDVNGDGWSDILVGAPGSNRAYLYFGRNNGIDTASAVTLTPTGAPNNFGVSVAGVGDVNADGYSDVAIGTDGANVVYLWYGGASGLGATPTGLSAPSGANGFGRAVAGAGDVNGDGYPDVIVGAYNSSTAYIFRGGSLGVGSSPSYTLTGAGAQAGLAVDGAGDVNGDGYGDVLVGAPGADRTAVYYGGASGPSASPSATLTPTYSGYAFGSALAGFGDFNLDGFSDVVVASPGRAVQIYRGASSGLSQQYTFTGSTTFGQSVAALFRRLLPWS